MRLKANYIDIKARDIYPVEVVVADKKIKSIIKIDEECSSYILPGFIDAHIHIESSMLPPSEFARLAVVHGSVATISDPHEIANVVGIDGVEFMLDSAKGVEFHFYFGASPCVPATPFETSGATLGVEEIERLLQRDDILYLSEVMNFPAVLSGDQEMLEKIAIAKRLGKVIDGHAPALSGDELQRYIDVGITTDHEAFSYEEGLEKIQRGMKILIREGSAAKNFDTLAPLIDKHYQNLMFCSDDRHPNDLKRGHINDLVKRALARGDDLFKVLQIASINPIEHYGLDLGMLRVGDSADFIEIDDLENFEIVRTIINGSVVAQNQRSLIESIEIESINNFQATPKSAEDFWVDECESVEVIEAIDHQLITHEREAHLPSVESHAISDIDHGILKITVINRYEDSKPAIAHVSGFGLTEGAIASSVAHDSHNIIAVGCDEESISKAVNLIIKNRGGISAVSRTQEWVLPLDIAGVMSSGDGFEVADRYEYIDRVTKDILGSTLSAPFMTLSFMALLVIPDLKLSDKGLFDGREFHFVDSCR